jgi:hypothetical protein
VSQAIFIGVLELSLTLEGSAAVSALFRWTVERIDDP